MPISFDTSGFQQQDQHTRLHPATGDRVTFHHHDGPPVLPADLEDLPRLRHGLALKHSEAGCLIEAQVIQLGGLPALLEIVKLAFSNRPGQAFGVTVTVPRASSRVVVSYLATDRGTTGVREGVLAAEVGYENWVQPHPYAPELQGRLPFHAGDDPRYDARFPDHPLSRARAWVHRFVGSARVDPQFAALPPLQRSPPVGATLTTAIPGIPIGGCIALQIGERQTYWRMADGDLQAKLGRGVTGRSPLSENRFRDLVLIDEQTGHALIPDRYTTDGAMTGAGTRLVPATAEEIGIAVNDETVREAYRWVGRMISEASSRSEFLTLQPLEHQGEECDPYVLMGIRYLENETTVIASCSPAPSENTPFRGMSTLEAPASPETIEGIALRVMYVMLEWGKHPLTMAITFNRAT